MTKLVLRVNKPMSIEEQDMEWFFNQCEKGAIKKPDIDKELKFAELVAVYRKALNSEVGARNNAFKMVMFI
jgi:hypothetical protein